MTKIVLLSYCQCYGLIVFLPVDGRRKIGRVGMDWHMCSEIKLYTKKGLKYTVDVIKSWSTMGIDFFVFLNFLIFHISDFLLFFLIFFKMLPWIAISGALVARFGILVKFFVFYIS